MVQFAAADEVFHALANPTRRKVLERLSVGPATVSELAAPFDMRFPPSGRHSRGPKGGGLLSPKSAGECGRTRTRPGRLRSAKAGLPGGLSRWRRDWTASTSTSNNSRRRSQDHERAI